MTEPAKERKEPRVRLHSKQRVHFINSVRESLACAVTSQERVDVLATAKKHADREWFYWSDVRKYIDNQLAVVEYEAQLKLPL